MDPAGSVTQLLKDLESGTPSVRRQAEADIWQRYFPQLLALARRSIDARTRRRENEEEFLQSMYQGQAQLRGTNHRTRALADSRAVDARG